MIFLWLFFCFPPFQWLGGCVTDFDAACLFFDFLFSPLPSGQMDGSLIDRSVKSNEKRLDWNLSAILCQLDTGWSDLTARAGAWPSRETLESRTSVIKPPFCFGH